MPMLPSPQRLVDTRGSSLGPIPSGGNRQLCADVGAVHGLPGAAHVIIDVAGYLLP